MHTIQKCRAGMVITHFACVCHLQRHYPRQPPVLPLQIHQCTLNLLSSDWSPSGKPCSNTNVGLDPEALAPDNDAAHPHRWMSTTRDIDIITILRLFLFHFLLTLSNIESHYDGDRTAAIS